jgi:hypothetical protein
MYAGLGVDSSFRPSGADELVNASDGARPELDGDLEATLRNYFRPSDDRLSAVLGRPLPWQET